MYEKLMSDKKPSFPISKNLDSYETFYNRKLTFSNFL